MILTCHQTLTSSSRYRVRDAFEGFEIFKDVLGTDEIEKFRAISNALAAQEKKACVRVHLDPTPESNGALRVIRSSNKSGKLKPGHVAKATERGQEVVCSCLPGDVLKMSPLILHASRRSEQPARRRILHFEYAHKDGLHKELQWSRYL